MPSPTRAMIVSSVAPPTRRLDVRPHRDARLHAKLNAVLADRVDRLPPQGRVRHVDDLRVHARLHGVEDVAAGEVDRGRGLPRQVDVGLVGGDHRVDHALHVAAGQHVRLPSPAS
jgi:hypothetical protein